MSLELKKVRAGHVLTVAAVVRDGTCQFEESIKSVGGSNPHAARKILNTLDRAANFGLETLDQARFRPLGDGLYEFKEHSAGLRVFWCHDEHRESVIILQSMWSKAGKVKRQPAEIEKAKALMAIIRKAGKLPFREDETE